MKPIKLTDAIAYAIIIISFAALILAMSSCNAPQQAAKKYESAKKKHLPTVARAIRIDFPCIEKPDTIKVDSIVIKEKTVKQLVPYPVYDTLTGKTDTLWFEADCKCKDTVIYQTQHIKVIDSAFNYLAKSNIDSVQKAAKELIYKAEQRAIKQENAKVTWRTIAFIFIGIVLVAMIVILRKFKII